jgi:hypothetical protein
VPDPADAEALLKTHLPVLRYDSQGSFMADSAAILPDRVANALKRAGGDVIADGKGQAPRSRLGLDLLGGHNYSDGQEAKRSDFLDAVGKDYVIQARDMHHDNFANRIYGRAERADDGGWWLQYWFFYLYNDKSFLGFGKHEGDWEMVQVALDPSRKPFAVAFAQHTHGQRYGWGAVQKDGRRPIVYVARGSQASYATPGRHDAPLKPDYADGGGQQVAGATLVPIGPRKGPPWVDWPGRWGSTRARVAGESDSPRGPAHQDKWHHPATFHEESDEVDPRRQAIGPAPPGPPTPEIAARREDDHAVVAYRFPPGAGLPAAVALVVSLDSPDDELPPATYMHEVDAPSGDFTHPLELEDERYEVRATAADEQGNMSEQAVAELA